MAKHFYFTFKTNRNDKIHVTFTETECTLRLKHLQAIRVRINRRNSVVKIQFDSFVPGNKFRLILIVLLSHCRFRGPQVDCLRKNEIN